MMDSSKELVVMWFPLPVLRSAGLTRAFILALKNAASVVQQLAWCGLPGVSQLCGGIGAYSRGFVFVACSLEAL